MRNQLLRLLSGALLVSGCMSTPSDDSDADGSAAFANEAEWTPLGTYTDDRYAVTAYAYRSPPNCGDNVRPAFFYLGGQGELPAPEHLPSLVAQLQLLGERFHPACTQLVVMGGLTGFNANTDQSDNAKANHTPQVYARFIMEDAARSIGMSTNYFLNRFYPGRNYYFMGGSASALFGAYLFDKDEVYSNTREPNANGRAYRTQLKRVFFAGPPAGNFVNLCKHAAANSGGAFAAAGIAGKSCDYLKNLPESDGNLYVDSNGNRLGGFETLPAVHAYIGTEDELFGGGENWTGPAGVLDFVQSQGPLQVNKPDGTIEGIQELTYRELKGATHSNVWIYKPEGETSVYQHICEKMASDVAGVSAAACQ